MNYHISTSSWWINFGKLCCTKERPKKIVDFGDKLDTGAAQGQDQWPQRPRSLQWLRSLGFQEPRLHSRDLGTWANTLSAVWRCGAVRHVRDRFLGWLGEKELMVFGDGFWWFMMIYDVFMNRHADFSHYSGRDCWSVSFIQALSRVWFPLIEEFASQSYGGHCG